MDLVRDIWAFTLDGDDRAPSLRNIWRLVENEELRSILRAKFTQPRETGWIFDGEWSEADKQRLQAKLDAKDVEAEGKSFDEAYNRVRAALPALFECDLAARMGRARSKAIAHYDMTASKGEPKQYSSAEIELKWDEPRSFLKTFEPILFDVVLLATWGSYDVDEYERVHRLYAADFWARIQGKPPVNDVP